MNTKIIGIVVLFHPPSDVTENILSYLSGLDKLIIWSNSLQAKIILPEEYREQKEKIIEMGDGKNVGLGMAYNTALNYALEHHYTHLLTMDQDSRFIDNDFQRYLEMIDRSGEKTIFSPNYIINGKVLCAEQASLIEVETSASSGSVYPVDIFSKTGLFRDDFFIFNIDVEFSLRAKKYGIPTKIASSVYLLHRMGYPKKKHKLLWKTFIPNEYSPASTYYLVRNGIIAKYLYPKAVHWKGYMFYWFYKRMFCVLCFEDNKYAKCKALIWGYIHGKRKKLGKQTIFNES
jgi:rhamnosyltransferase